ncbi:MAG: nodulation protein NfeD [Alphaproteobacteria bacterium]|nr:nodulation protein NfeD [Alphaproteobacteria bacterium]
MSDALLRFHGMLRAFVLACIGIVALTLLPGTNAASGAADEAPQAHHVLIIDITGVIGVATKLHVENGLEQAQREHADAVILRIDTPGGLVSSMREIVEAILASPVPVIGFVAPSGAHAASAGTYIMAATNIAAMAPGTQIGAATPIQFGGTPLPTNAPGPLSPSNDDKAKDKPVKPDKPQGETTEDRKSINDAVALIKSLAQLRGRNAVWLEKAVRDAETLTADEALKDHVIEIVANDIPDLIAKADGRSVTINGAERKLTLQDASTAHVEIGWRTQLLSAIADPNVAFILLMIGVYGIFFEFWSPGYVAPGVIGGICLLLALTALTALPLNFGALALVLFGIALMVAEHFTPSFGVLGIGGIVSFVLGAVFLFDPSGSDVHIGIAWPVIAGSALTSALLVSAVVAFAIRARMRPALAGGEELIGIEGEVVDWQGAKGTVRVRGELWSAASDKPFERGARVRILARKALVLTVGAP